MRVVFGRFWFWAAVRMDVDEVQCGSAGFGWQVSLCKGVRMQFGHSGIVRGEFEEVNR